MKVNIPDISLQVPTVVSSAWSDVSDRVSSGVALASDRIPQVRWSDVQAHLPTVVATSRSLVPWAARRSYRLSPVAWGAVATVGLLTAGYFAGRYAKRRWFDGENAEIRERIERAEAALSNTGQKVDGMKATLSQKASKAGKKAKAKMSRKNAAASSNETGNGNGNGNGHATKVYAQLSRQELYAQAQSLDISGRSKMNKEQLAEAVARHEATLVG